MPNFFATFALATYPLFIVGLFLVYRPPVAVALALLLAELLLPPLYNLPLSSPKWLNKATIPPLATIMAALVFARSYLRRSRPLRGVESPFVLMFVSSYFTMSTNQDPLRRGPTTLQGEQFGDFTSDVMRTTVGLWIAFYLGRVMFKTSRDLVSLCKIMAVAALFYTLPTLWEIRMSPQIQATIYGYGQLSFLQSMRWGGYRPNVFTDHGLELAEILLLCLVLLVALARARRRVGPFPTTLACVYLAFVLVMCKSTGAVVYALLLVPLLAFSSPKAQLRVAVLLVVMFVAYPLLRFGDLIPTKAISDFLAQHLPADRAQSLSYRFEMEQGLLNNTQLRPWFGWGGYARAFVYDTYSGRVVTIPDGSVILQLSTRGLVGFFAYFGPFVAAVVRAYRVVPRIKERSAQLLLCALTLACAVVLFDLIINSTFPPILMLLFGALWTLPTALVAKEAAAEAATVEANVAQPEYSPAY